MYRHFCPGTPVILVGMKSDLREGVQNFSQPINLVPRDNIEQVAKETGIGDTNPLRWMLFKYYTFMSNTVTGASAYYETSALTGEGVSMAVTGAINTALTSQSSASGRRRGFVLPWRW